MVSVGSEVMRTAAGFDFLITRQVHKERVENTEHSRKYMKMEAAFWYL